MTREPDAAPRLQTLEVPVAGMDCAECTMHVRQAIAELPGVESADVLLGAEKAIVRLDPSRVGLANIRQAVEAAGYSVPAAPEAQPIPERQIRVQTRRITTLLALVFGAVLFVVVVGEWLGLFERLTARVPFVVGLGLVVLGGWPVFVNVVRASLRRQVTSHTLMTLGVLAALAIGQWTTAAVVVFFMRVGDYTERLTAERARGALRQLVKLAPQTARVERDGEAREVPVAAVRPGEVVVVRPGERIPVDGEVVAGQATVDQAAITGEAMPIEAGPGTAVFAATIAQLGALRVRATRIGADTTFGRVIRLVEEAEANRSEVQRFADRFTAYYLPIVATIAAVTFLLRRDPAAATAVLVVACSCSIALATPIAMLASVGAGARRGLLIKGGKYLEALARADVILVDKTGTLTLGKPRVTDVVPAEDAAHLLQLAASAERYSEHPLAQAVREAARQRGLALEEPREFEARPGLGVRAAVNGSLVEVGSQRMLGVGDGRLSVEVDRLVGEAKTLLYVAVDGQPAGVIAVADTPRPEAAAAIRELRGLGFARIELLTGDHEQAAAALAGALDIPYRANLLPEHKIDIVREHQAAGRVVVMVGDGVNDAPALAQADVGIAMGAAGADIALEAAHIALLRDDWRLVPEAIQIARRTMRVVKLNLVFTGLYNLAGLGLAAFGLLPPIFAAAVQSLPDLGILANSSRLLRAGSRRP